VKTVSILFYNKDDKNIIATSDIHSAPQFLQVTPYFIRNLLCMLGLEDTPI
jgi:hypothetical protein